MEKAKYIILNVSELPIPIIFHPIFHHSDIAGGRKVFSAGFMEVGQDGKVYCFGKSVSLKTESKPEDAEIISKLLSPPMF